ncbi:MAG: hypothetical protein FWF53_04500 [Candidatus Azobacteroides sp.]|nr:hypothetical protein [Candidatus Azobacteroides sp.]
MIDESGFKTKKELFKFLVDNKEQLTAEKKFDMKKADSISFDTGFLKSESASKSDDLLSKDEIEVTAVINTTNLLDSHHDVHIDGLWNKSISEAKKIYHVQEHNMSFDHVISTDVKASTKKMTWKELGFDFDGTTEALIFDSKIKKDRNPFMFEQYAKGYIDNHSVGMRYVKLALCINDADFKEEKADWDKYIDRVADKEEAEKSGYFWAVTEAKLIEGSAVLMGSNYATPTLRVKNDMQPSEGTAKTITEPPQGTRKESLFEKIGKFKN